MDEEKPATRRGVFRRDDERIEFVPEAEPGPEIPPGGIWPPGGGTKPPDSLSQGPRPGGQVLVLVDRDAIGLWKQGHHDRVIEFDPDGNPRGYSCHRRGLDKDDLWAVEVHFDRPIDAPTCSIVDEGLWIAWTNAGATTLRSCGPVPVDSGVLALGFEEAMLAWTPGADIPLSDSAILTPDVVLSVAEPPATRGLRRWPRTEAWPVWEAGDGSTLDYVLVGLAGAWASI